MLKKEKEPKVYVVIDYPKENEIINHPSYSIKIGTNINGKVEISIDGGDWQLCREAGGSRWYDWANYTKGKHNIIARVCDDKGKILEKSSARRCSSI